MKRFKYLYIIVFIAGLLTSAYSSIVCADIIYPGDNRWIRDLRSGGNAEITGANPRSGNGSLALTTSGSLDDWAFYSRYSGDTSWGLLSDINDISFDWYRDPLGITDIYGSPWLAQTPVLRLHVRDTNGITSELVWEKWYTDSSAAITGSWITQDNVLEQNFWRYIPTEGYTINDGTNSKDIFQKTLMAEPVSFWSGPNNVQYPYSADAVVYGLSIGVGSYWPDDYLGYVDNIRLAFGENGTVIDDNFEIPVPEPATILLLGTGLVTFAVRHKRRKRK